MVDSVEPGLAQVQFSRPDTPPPARSGEIGFYGGVARKSALSAGA
ncbi:hypothetical protein [Streptomyces sp. NPDC093984]